MLMAGWYAVGTPQTDQVSSVEPALSKDLVAWNLLGHHHVPPTRTKRVITSPTYGQWP